MLPTSFTLMKSRAYADSRTYSAYQGKNATVIGEMKPRRVLRSPTDSSERWTARYSSEVVELGTSVVNVVPPLNADPDISPEPYEGVSRVTARRSAGAPSGSPAAPSGTVRQSPRRW